MSFPWCAKCRHEVLPSVGCACVRLQAEHDAIVELDRRERQAEQDYYDQVDAQLAAERARLDADAAADVEYEAQRARAREQAQAEDDFRRGD